MIALGHLGIAGFRNGRDAIHWVRRTRAMDTASSAHFTEMRPPSSRMPRMCNGRRARPLAALRVRFAQATRRLRRGRILRVRCFDAVFGRAGARPSRSGNFIEIALPNPQMNQYLNAIVNRKIGNRKFLQCNRESVDGSWKASQSLNFSTSQPLHAIVNRKIVNES